jgi:hypothetical protein
MKRGSAGRDGAAIVPAGPGVAAVFAEAEAELFDAEPIEVNPRQIQLPLAQGQAAAAPRSWDGGQTTGQPRDRETGTTQEQSEHISKNKQLRNIPSIAPLESGILPTQQPTLEDDFALAADTVGDEESLASSTGSFAPLGATGAFAPVSDELLKYHDKPEDIYIDDVDDSAMVGGDDGSYAPAPHIAAMPTSRARSFFGNLGDRLSGRKKHEQLDDSPSSWLGVEEDYDAREAGGRIGSWSNFSEDDADVRKDAGVRKDTDSRDASGWDDADSRDADARKSSGAHGRDASARKDADDWDDADGWEDDGWKGGAYGGGSHEADFAAIESLAEQLIDKEVWLVATGSQEAEGAGIKALITNHGPAMRGAVIVNLDSVGAGELCYTTAEGSFRPRKTDQRLQSLATAAADIVGVRLDGAKFVGYQSDAGWALRQGVRAISLIGLDHDYPVAWRSKADKLEILNEDAIAAASELVVEIIKSA